MSFRYGSYIFTTIILKSLARSNSFQTPRCQN